MKRGLPWIVILLVVLGGIWIWMRWSSNPEAQIRKRMHELEEVISFADSDGLISAGTQLFRLTDFFTEDAELRLALEGERSRTIQGRAAILEAAKAARGLANGLEVDFLDLVITLSADKQSAEVQATGRAKESGSSELWIQELRFEFIRTEEGWLIDSVETVRMLGGCFDRLRTNSRVRTT